MTHVNLFRHAVSDFVTADGRSAHFVYILHLSYLRRYKGWMMFIFTIKNENGLV